MDDAPDAHGAGGGYAAAMLAKAFLTLETHPDPAVRERAAVRVERWRQVLRMRWTVRPAMVPPRRCPGFPTG